jgi:alginate O-acetyltransferase complex protein AlgI
MNVGCGVMLFNSYEFIFVFLPITLFVYFFLAKKRYTKVATGWLVLASLVFYLYWNIYYLPLLLISIFFNYNVGKWLEKTRQKNVLIFGIVFNLALLAYYKYAGFFISSINTAFFTDVSVPEIVLPLGISFFTFTQTAYLVDAYRGETKGYSLLTYSLFVTIFPHLIAGPILYHKDIIPQFSKLKNFVVNYKNLSLGISMFSIGLFKKVIIADALAPWVKLAFDNADQLTFIEAWCGALAYTFQLYFDFSGYSEMAVGLGLMLNFKLPINFNSPYRSTSVIEFWRRWHMTLSAFLKDYLYIPLGGNRYGELKKMRNLLITMLLAGLWHGAGWTFVIWGGLHGLYLIINHQWKKCGILLPKTVNWSITFICVIVAWVFFRAGSVHDALTIVKAMGNVGNIALPASGVFEAKLGILGNYGIKFMEMNYWHGTKEIIVLAGAIFVLTYCKNTQERLRELKPNWKWIGIVTIILVCGILSLSKTSEFLYFQF